MINKKIEVIMRMKKESESDISLKKVKVKLLMMNLAAHCLRYSTRKKVSKISMP